MKNSTLTLKPPQIIKTLKPLSLMTRGSKLFKDKFNRLGWETKYDSVEAGYLDQAGIILMEE
jgi:hypothetical protein